MSYYELFFIDQHIPNDMKIGYAIFHLIDTAQLQYIQLTGNKSATDGVHSAHCTNTYLSLPTQGDPLDERQQINIYTTCDEHPSHDYRGENVGGP